MRKARAILVIVAALGTLITLSSAQAAHPITVTLAVSTHAYPVKDSNCPVSVAHGVDGIAVLDAAKATGCITSYTTIEYPGLGTFVRCIDQRCGDGPQNQYLRYWAMRENCIYTSYGVDGFRADAGDELSFTYEPWPVSFVPMDPLCLV